MRFYKYEIRRWTLSAIDCYKRGCICEGCFIYEKYSKPGKWNCYMKSAVIELVRKFGKPENVEKDWILE